MQRSPYGQLPLFLLYKMQWSGLGRFGGGSLGSVLNFCVPDGDGKGGQKEGRCGSDGRNALNEDENFGQS